MVLLEHTPLTGVAHFDWMLERPGVDEGPLVTFRLDQRPDHCPLGRRLSSHRIGDHRRAYLDYEGPLSGNRGSVRRVASGIVWSLEETPTLMLLTLQWESGDHARWLAKAATPVAGTALEKPWEWLRET